MILLGNLGKIESGEFYLDVAFKRANEEKRKYSDLKELKLQEISRIDIIKDKLIDSLTRIIKSFPKIEELSLFYQELIKATLDYASLKKSLGSVGWAIERIKYFSRIYKDKLNKSYDYKTIKKHIKEYYGRVSSVMKQINPYLAYLEECRKTFKEYPLIKDLPTACIFGFPNVGKSTLLAKLTDAKPKIANYPFTTKKLNLGYIKEPNKTIQLIDTPGTLNRMEKMNNIELQAYLAIKYLSDLVIFVFDPTYDKNKQKKLLERVKDKKYFVYISKSDIIDVKEVLEEFPDAIISVDELKRKILENFKI